MAWYLSRVEPFASLAIELHDGSFDKPDRQFLSVEKCWESCASPSCETDVKELIPDIPEIPSVTGGVIPDTKTNVPSTTGGVLPFK